MTDSETTDEAETETTETSLTIRRTIPAPVERVWEAIADQEQVSRWFAPGTRACRMDAWDFREGGSFSVAFVPTEDDGFGGPSPASGTFQGIVPEKELVMSWNWDFGEEDVREPESRIIFRLRPASGGTELTFVHEDLPNRESVGDHLGGWMSTLPKLAGLVD